MLKICIDSQTFFDNVFFYTYHLNVDNVILLEQEPEAGVSNARLERTANKTDKKNFSCE